MGYYIRVLTPGVTPVAPSRLRQAAEAHQASVDGDVDVAAWDQLVATNAAGRDVCCIERSEVTAGSLGEAEIGEFQGEISTCRPTSAARWLQSYLVTVRTIYAFQALWGAYEEDGWEIVDAVREAVLSCVGGIVQADNEGFFNEEGHHILWQLSAHVSGVRWMAVLKDGRWQKFEMDLGNPRHRAAFKAGKIPKGVEQG